MSSCSAVSRSHPFQSYVRLCCLLKQRLAPHQPGQGNTGSVAYCFCSDWFSHFCFKSFHRFLTGNQKKSHLGSIRYSNVTEFNQPLCLSMNTMTVCWPVFVTYHSSLLEHCRSSQVCWKPDRVLFQHRPVWSSTTRRGKMDSYCFSTWMKSANVLKVNKGLRHRLMRETPVPVSCSEYRKRCESTCSIFILFLETQPDNQHPNSGFEAWPLSSLMKLLFSLIQQILTCCVCMCVYPLCSRRGPLCAAKRRRIL